MSGGIVVFVPEPEEMMMDRSETCRLFFEAVIKEGLFASERNLAFRLESLFADRSWAGLRMLEIGGGAGVYSLYAAARGAADVVCLEPAGDGSTAGMAERFRRIRDAARIEHAQHLPLTFQAYEPEGDPFDLVLLYNSVNHLDEAACAAVHRDPDAREVYRALFSRLHGLTRPGAQVILCDCSRYNLYPLLGLRNPIDPSIDWDLHQTPGVWEDLLRSAGFGRPALSWMTFNPLGRLGRFFLGNRLAAFFLVSHFRLEVERLDTPE